MVIGREVVPVAALLFAGLCYREDFPWVTRQARRRRPRTRRASSLALSTQVLSNPHHPIFALRDALPLLELYRPLTEMAFLRAAEAVLHRPRAFGACYTAVVTELGDLVEEVPGTALDATRTIEAAHAVVHAGGTDGVARVCDAILEISARTLPSAGVIRSQEVRFHALKANILSRALRAHFIASRASRPNNVGVVPIGACRRARLAVWFGLLVV